MTLENPENISPELLLQAYRIGVFPMGEVIDDEEVLLWFEPRYRGVIPLQEFHISKNVRRLIRKSRFYPTINRAFTEVMEGCADRESTWITPAIYNLYSSLNERGNAHSLEVWEDDKLIGGLYGTHLGGVFFGESMFQRAPEIHKVALYYCHNILVANGFRLWDTQFYTRHLAKFGCKSIPQARFKQLLEPALAVNAKFRLPEDFNPRSA